jgi:hypothetical protein
MALAAAAIRDAVTLASAKAHSAEPLMLDLQFAHHLNQLHLQRRADLLHEVRPGVHGLMMHSGPQTAWVFPASALAMNTTLPGQVNRMLGELKLPLTSLETVGLAKGLPLYRFEVIHVVRCSPDEPFHVLYRGGALLPPVPLDESGLRTLHQQVLRTVMRRQLETGDFAGIYEPTPDQFEPPKAKFNDTAFTAYALGRTALLPSLDSKTREAAVIVARRAVEMLIPSITGDAFGNVKASDTPVVTHLDAAAFTLLALTDTPGFAAYKPQRMRLDTIVRSMQNPTGEFRINVQDTARPAPLVHQALATLAMVRMYDQTREPANLHAAQACFDVMWKETDERLATAMPWLAFAEIELARIDQPSRNYGRLSGIVGKLWRRQVQPTRLADDNSPSPDTVGGFVLGPDGEEPTWQSATVLAADAQALRPTGFVTPADRPIWLVNTALGARYLAQLTMQKPGCYYVRNPAEAIGGVRVSLTNNRQPCDVQAMTLLALSEFQSSLDALAGRTIKD